MIVITKDAESTFKTALESYDPKARNQRCIYIRMSKMKETPDLWFFKMCEELSAISDGHIGQIYLCYDNDVFALMPHLTTKHMEKFQERFINNFPNVDIEQLISLHEIRMDMSVLKNICARKIEELKKFEKIKANELLKKQEREYWDHTFASIDKYLTASIAQRRISRNEIEILVIEDDALSRMMIKNVLMSDYKVNLVEDGQGALAAYAHYAPDVVFLDIGLPDISGHEILERILAMDPEAYVIMFSGRKDHENVLKALNIGACGFIGKPFTRGKLFQYIEQASFVQIKQSRSPLTSSHSG